MPKPFVFFDLGQTLVTEWDFISYFDAKFLDILNGFGARIDMRNYRAVRDSIIRNREIGYGSVKELVASICRSILPSGYENPILQRIAPDIKEGRKMFFQLADGAEQVVKELSKEGHELGIIANQTEDIVNLLQRSGLDRYFKVTTISGAVNMKKPDPGIFQLALRKAEKLPHECIMVGDRLDTDICPANRIGMVTIRVTDSLFALQEPREACEQPTYTVSRLAEVPSAVRRAISVK
jgi:HAD superfamily hydrolase (TIGR01662 family)